jgi:hypothetical protein
MQRLRTHWLALMGAMLLLTLTVSAAFGAPPSGTDEGNRGQTVAAFVHELVFGADEADDEANEDQEEADEEEDLEDDLEEEDLEEDTEEGSELLAREVPEEFANHGECVSEAAHDTDGFEESDAANNGEWVSDHARFICWGLEPPEDEVADTTGDETDTDLEEEADADELAANEQAKADREAARAERLAAREAAKAEREAARAAEQTVQTTGPGQGQGNGGGDGNGHGRGGGRP